MKRHNIQIIAVLVIIILTAIPTSLLYYQTKLTIVSEAGKEARDIGITIANFLEQDIEQYKNLSNVQQYETEEYDQQYYQTMLQLFQGIKAETGADFVFTEKLVSDENIAYVLDGEPTDSESFSPIGALDTISEPEREAFQTGKPTTTDLIRDPIWGYYITGFAPIFDPATNEVIGLVGVDYSIDYIEAILHKLYTIVLIVFVLVVAILSSLALLVINAYHKRMNRDFLTGLYNRKHFEEELQRMIKTSKEKKQTFSLMIIDVDNFKQINDHYGHDVGDIALKKVAQFLCSNLKEGDMAFRFGGDEFSVILPNTTKEMATFVSKRLSNELSYSMITVNQDELIKVYVSIGLAEYHVGQSPAALIHNADQEMYREKFSKLKKSK